jgi:hypothetical protein
MARTERFSPAVIDYDGQMSASQTARRSRWLDEWATSKAVALVVTPIGERGAPGC